MGDSSGTQAGASGIGLRYVVRLLVVFAVLVVPCLALWWWALPLYARGLAAVSGLLLRLLQVPIQETGAVPGGPFNTGTALVLVLNGIPNPLPVNAVSLNLPTYVALVLASGLAPWRRRGIALAAGIPLLALTHVAFVVGMFYFRSEFAGAREVPTAIAQLFFTLPFLLWIVLVHWREFQALIARAETPGDGEQSPDAPD
jgi:hypothetical protein